MVLARCINRAEYTGYYFPTQGIIQGYHPPPK